MECSSRDTLGNVMAKLSDLSLCTYNCRSIKNSVYDVQKLCAKYDIIFLQEHWLPPCELNTLSNIDTEFLAFGVISNGYYFQCY